EDEGDGHAREEAEQRVELPPAHDREEGDEGAADQELAVGEIQNAGDAVLQVEPERDEPVHAAEDETAEKHFEHAGPSRRPPNKRSGRAPRPDPAPMQAMGGRHDQAGFGNSSGLAPDLSAG